MIEHFIKIDLGEGSVPLFGNTVGGIVFRFFVDICHGHNTLHANTLHIVAVEILPV